MKKFWVLSAVCCLAIAGGCVSAPPGARAGWSISLVSVQLGGSSTTVETMNYLAGTNVVQRHSLPIEAEMSADTDLKPALK